MSDEELKRNLNLYNYLKEFLSKEKLKKIENLVNYRTEFMIPIIEDIYQFRNAAAIVRSMEAFGFQSLYALENRNEFIPEATVAKGADKWIDITYMPSGLDSLKKIKEKGYKIIAVSPEREAISIQEFVIERPLALIFGTEFKGVTEETLNFAEQCISIPMKGFTESLNVSVAAAVSFYEIRNKLENSNLDWKISEEKKINIKIAWAINSISSGKEIAEHYLKKINK